MVPFLKTQCCLRAAAYLTHLSRALSAAHLILLRGLSDFTTLVLLRSQCIKLKHAAPQAMAALRLADGMLARCQAWLPAGHLQEMEQQLNKISRSLHTLFAGLPPQHAKHLQQAAAAWVPLLLGAPSLAPAAGEEQQAAAPEPVPQPPAQPAPPGEQPLQASASEPPQPAPQPLLPQPPHLQPPSAGERCSLCGQAAPTPARCARCHTTVYCGRRCQGRHWLGGHREECTRIVTQRFNARLAAGAAAQGSGGPRGGMPVDATAASGASSGSTASSTSMESLD